VSYEKLELKKQAQIEP